MSVMLVCFYSSTSLDASFEVLRLHR
jgi:hypothetical protein